MHKNSLLLNIIANIYYEGYSIFFEVGTLKWYSIPEDTVRNKGGFPLEDKTCFGVEMAMEAIVGKWKPIILYHLMENETLRFNELKRAIPNITQKMLTSQLRELEYHNIVHREVYPQVPPKVEYSLTKYGEEIIPILKSMQKWGTSHIKHMEKSKVK